MTYEKTNLASAYNSYRNFSKFREEEYAKLTSSETEEGQLQAEIKEAQTLKKRTAAECDLRIALAKSRLAQLTGTNGLTELRVAFNDRMRSEKEARKHLWESEVVRAHDSGMTPRTIADVVPMLASPVTVYNILRRSASGMESETVSTDETLPRDSVWEYHNHLGVHRYALNSDRSMVKFHDVDETLPPVVLTYPSLKYVQGNADLRDSVSIARIEDLRALLDDEYDESRIRLGSNKYRPQE